MSGDIVHTVSSAKLFSLSNYKNNASSRPLLSITQASELLDLPMDAIKSLMHFGQLNYRVNSETKQIEIEERSVLKFLAQ